MCSDFYIVVTRCQPHPIHADRDFFVYGDISGSDVYHCTPYHVATINDIGEAAPCMVRLWFSCACSCAGAPSWASSSPSSAPGPSRSRALVSMKTLSMKSFLNVDPCIQVSVANEPLCVRNSFEASSSMAPRPVESGSSNVDGLGELTPNSSRSAQSTSVDLPSCIDTSHRRPSAAANQFSNVDSAAALTEQLTPQALDNGGRQGSKYSPAFQEGARPSSNLRAASSSSSSKLPRAPTTTINTAHSKPRRVGRGASAAAGASSAVPQSRSRGRLLDSILTVRSMIATTAATSPALMQSLTALSRLLAGGVWVAVFIFTVWLWGGMFCWLAAAGMWLLARWAAAAAARRAVATLRQGRVAATHALLSSAAYLFQLAKESLFDAARLTNTACMGCMHVVCEGAACRTARITAAAARAWRACARPINAAVQAVLWCAACAAHVYVRTAAAVEGAVCVVVGVSLWWTFMWLSALCWVGLLAHEGFKTARWAVGVAIGPLIWAAGAVMHPILRKV